MNQLVLKPEILEKIKSTGKLFGDIADILHISAMTLPKMILQNDRRLTQASVLGILREHLKINNDSDLLCELQETPKELVAQ